MSERILRRPTVEARTGLARSTIYDAMKDGTFPLSVSLGARLVGWRETDIEAWMADLKHTQPRPKVAAK